MSDPDSPGHSADSANAETDEAVLVLKAKSKDLGGFSVRRLLPSIQQKMVGPWIFFDHLGPANFAPGEGIDVRPHPHINLATVTYLFDGEIYHRDSLGNALAISPGAINLMVAGKGIVHSERVRPEIRDKGQTVHALQLWLALPEEYEETDPAFFHVPAGDIPTTEIAGAEIRVMMGHAFGLSSPVPTFADTLYIEAKLEQGAQLNLPGSEALGIYIVAGSIEIGEQLVSAQSLCIPDKTIQSLKASQATTLVIIGGEQMAPRHIEWNFVSSDKARIAQAKARWEAQEFPKVPGDEEEFIPLPK